MFDRQTAKKIQAAIEKEHRFVPHLVDIMHHMSLVPSLCENSCHVYGMQYGDATVLANLSYDSDGVLIAVRSKIVSW